MRYYHATLWPRRASRSLLQHDLDHTEQGIVSVTFIPAFIERGGVAPVTHRAGMPRAVNPHAATPLQQCVADVVELPVGIHHGSPISRDTAKARRPSPRRRKARAR